MVLIQILNLLEPLLFLHKDIWLFVPMMDLLPSEKLVTSLPCFTSYKTLRNGVRLLSIVQMVHILLLVPTTQISTCMTLIMDTLSSENAPSITPPSPVSIGQWTVLTLDQYVTPMSSSSSQCQIAIKILEVPPPLLVPIGSQVTANSVGPSMVSSQKEPTAPISTVST